MKRKLDFGIRGQVTIFILIAIIIVSVILIFFLWARPSFFSENVGIEGFEACVRDSLNDGIVELENTAGLIDSDFSYTYMGEDFNYLCYTSEFYKTCTVQVPLLKKTFNDNLGRLVADEVETCYEASLDSLKDQGYEVSSGNLTYEVDIESGVVRMKINAPTGVAGKKFTRFNVEVDSPIYDMLMIATSILQFESTYGDSDVSSMMFYYPEYYVNKVKRGEGTTIYSLEHKTFGDKFKFASRSLVFPAGYDI